MSLKNISKMAAQIVVGVYATRLTNKLVSDLFDSLFPGSKVKK